MPAVVVALATTHTPADANPGPPCDTSGQACVVIQVVGASGQVGPLHYVDDVATGADVVGESYPVPNTPGVPVGHGTSVRQLVSAVVDLSTVTFVEVGGGDNDSYDHHLLTPAQLGPGGSNGFTGGLLPVLYQDSAHEMDYVRPLRAGDPTDDQKAEGPDKGLLSSANNGSILITVHQAGAPIDVHVTATPTDDTGRTFALSTSPGGPALSYAWYLPSGPGSTDPTPTYGFPSDSQAGTYPITVGVTDPSDGSFGWGTTTVQIGPAPTPTPSSTPTSPGPGGGGPSSSVGPTHAPTHATGTPHPHPTSGGGGTATSSPTTSPTGTATSTASASATSGPTASASTGPTKRPTSSPTATSTPTDAGGPEVTGILLSADDTGGGGPTTVSDLPTPSAAARPIGRPALRVDPLAWGGVVLVLLLVAGASSESPGLRRRLARWSKMGP